MNVCQTPSAGIAWTASIPVAAGAISFDMRGVAGGPTDDVVVSVASYVSNWLLEMHRFDASGDVVSIHQEAPPPGYPDSTNPVIDADNDVGDAYVVQDAALTFRRIDPSGAALNADTTYLYSPYPEQLYLHGAAADGAGNLYVSVGADPLPMHAFPFTAGMHLFQLPPAGPLTEVPLALGFYPLPHSPLPVSADGHVYDAAVLPPGTWGCPGAPLTVPAGGAIQISAHDAGGACAWAKLLAVPTAAMTTSWMDFTVGADGSLALAFAFTGTIDLGSGPLTSGASGALAVARFDAAGNLLWARSFDGLAFGFARVNAAGVMAIQSRYTGAVDLGAGPLPASGDTVVAVLDATGNLRWNKAVTVGDAGFVDIAVSPCALILATTSPNVDVGTGPLSSTTIVQGYPALHSIGVAAFAL